MCAPRRRCNQRVETTCRKDITGLVLLHTVPPRARPPARSDVFGSAGPLAFATATSGGRGGEKPSAACGGHIGRSPQPENAAPHPTALEPIGEEISTARAPRRGVCCVTVASYDWVGSCAVVRMGGAQSNHPGALVEPNPNASADAPGVYSCGTPQLRALGRWKHARGCAMPPCRTSGPRQATRPAPTAAHAS